MFDTHVNLHAPAYADDLPAVLDRARTAGITRMLAICDRLDHFPDVQKIAETHSDIWCSVGIHPHHAKDHTDITADRLEGLAAHPRVAAIGETGLDLHYNYSQPDQQEVCFRVHIEAARRTGLPVVVHTRKADVQTATILETEFANGPFAILLHCYTGGEELCQRALELNAFVSVSGILSFKNADAIRAVIRKVPLERILLETDCPWLAPVPCRGQRNEPGFLPHVADALAPMHGLSGQEIGKICANNALRLFTRIT